MRKILHIRRCAGAQQEPYWEDYVFETGDAGATVASALSSLRAEDRVSEDGSSGTVPGSSLRTGDRVSEDGSSDAWRPVMWEHSCLQKKCGACAMVINGVPRLACDTPLASLPGERVTLEPLGKFPVVEDLMTDRSAMMERLKELSVWLEADAPEGSEEMSFEAARCLQCGLCLEVCPNFAVGERFAGMAGMAPLARLIARLPEEQRGKTAESYRKGVYSGCGKSLACRDVCPAGIDIEMLLVKSSAAAVWRRWGSIR